MHILVAAQSCFRSRMQRHRRGCPCNCGYVIQAVTHTSSQVSLCTNVAMSDGPRLSLAVMLTACRTMYEDFSWRFALFRPTLGCCTLQHGHLCGLFALMAIQKCITVSTCYIMFGLLVWCRERLIEQCLCFGDHMPSLMEQCLQGTMLYLSV